MACCVRATVGVVAHGAAHGRRSDISSMLPRRWALLLETGWRARSWSTQRAEDGEPVGCGAAGARQASCADPRER